MIVQAVVCGGNWLPPQQTPCTIGVQHWINANVVEHDMSPYMNVSLHTEYCIFSGKRKGYLLADSGGTQGTCFSKKCWPSQGLEQVLGFLLHQKCVMCNNHIWIVLRCIELYLHASCALNSTELTHNNSHFIIITIIIINKLFFPVYLGLHWFQHTPVLDMYCVLERMEVGMVMACLKILS
jgi:hypothetical protein